MEPLGVARHPDTVVTRHPDTPLHDCHGQPDGWRVACPTLPSPAQPITCPLHLH